MSTATTPVAVRREPELLVAARSCILAEDTHFDLVGFISSSCPRLRLLISVPTRAG
jgi:hypothetical protein